FNGDILVDALLGIGVEGRLKSPFAEIVRRLKKIQLTPQISGGKPKLVSLDVPTGNLKPQLAIAFHSSKNQPNERVVPIGIPRIAETHFGPGDVQVFFPKRKPDSHKGENGRVVIVGGSRDFVGAPIFAAQGALAGGVDLVDLFVPQVNFGTARKSAPNVLVKSFQGDSEKLTPEAVPEILKSAKKNKAAIVLGPGLGRAPQTQQAVLEIAKKTKQPLVLDADALLPSFAKRGWGRFSPKKVVLTPHKGELKRLGGDAQKLTKKLRAVILQKGKVDAIHSPDQTRWNDAGSPTLTTGGTGDTLAGLVGAMLARGVEAFEAAGIAAFLLGITAEKLALKSESITPQMIAKKIPSVVKKILDQ
ncbi:MAG: NAD(P)H-hydrate dehydratase, partial [Patescibacteria group bacterium]